MQTSWSAQTDGMRLSGPWGPSCKPKKRLPNSGSRACSAPTRARLPRQWRRRKTNFATRRPHPPPGAGRAARSGAGCGAKLSVRNAGCGAGASPGSRGAPPALKARNGAATVRERYSKPPYTPSPPQPGRPRFHRPASRRARPFSRLLLEFLSAQADPRATGLPHRSWNCSTAGSTKWLCSPSILS